MYLNIFKKYDYYHLVFKIFYPLPSSFGDDHLRPQFVKFVPKILGLQMTSDWPKIFTVAKIAQFGIYLRQIFLFGWSWRRRLVLGRSWIDVACWWWDIVLKKDKVNLKYVLYNFAQIQLQYYLYFTSVLSCDVTGLDDNALDELLATDWLGLSG